MTLTAYVFPKRRIPQDVVTEMPYKYFFREPLHRQHSKRAETLIQSQGPQLYHIHWSLWRYLSWKHSLLRTWKTLRLFVNTLTGDDKYSVLSRDNLMQQNQMHLSQKQKTFSKFFFCIFQIYIKFWTFSKKMRSIAYIAYVFPKLPNPKYVVE